MTFKFSPFLLGLVLLGSVGSVLQIALGDSDVIVRGFVLALVLVSIAWVGWLLREAIRTGVASIPVFVWYWNIDRRSSSFLYFCAVVAFCAGLLVGLVTMAVYAGQAIKSL